MLTSTIKSIKQIRFTIENSNSSCAIAITSMATRKSLDVTWLPTHRSEKQSN